MIWEAGHYKTDPVPPQLYTPQRPMQLNKEEMEMVRLVKMEYKWLIHHHQVALQLVQLTQLFHK